MSVLLPPAFLARVAVTLLLAWLAAQLCLMLHTPLPWMLGPLISVSLLSIGGAPTQSWARLRDLGQWTIGGALGLYFTPAVTELVAGLWWAIALAIAWALLLGWAFGRWLYRVQAASMLAQPGMDKERLRATTYFSGAIGAASEMTLLAEREHARTDLVAAAHSLRLVIVTVSIPFALQWAGLQGDPGLTLPSVRNVQWPGFAWLVLAMLWAMQGCSGGALLSQGILNSAAEGLMRYVRHASPPDRDLLANGLFDMTALGDAPPESDTLRIAAELMGQQAAMRRFLAAYITPDSPCARLLALPADQCADAGQLLLHPLLRQFFAQAPISQDELRQCLASLQALSRICAGLSVDEFLGRLSLMVQSSIAQHQRHEKPSLQLLTVERSKGHEYEYVAVPFVNSRHFSPNASDPQRNMLYVAMTRASKRLWILESR